MIDIVENYSCLIEIIDCFEDNGYTIESPYKELQNINLKKDTIALKKYLFKKLNEDDTLSIINGENELISPFKLLKLRGNQPTSIAVERAFSIMKNILTDNRNFLDTNIYIYFFCH